MSQFNFSQAQLDSLLEKANTLEELDHIEKLWDVASQASIVGAEQIIKRNSFKFLKLAAPMLEHINFLAAATASSAVDATIPLWMFTPKLFNNSFP